MKNKQLLIKEMAVFMGINLFPSAFTHSKELFTKKNSRIGDYEENIYNPINNLQQMWDVADKLCIVSGRAGDQWVIEFYARSELLENKNTEYKIHQHRKTAVLMCIADILDVDVF